MSNDVEYIVVRNDEDQYSVWPAFRDMPAGWHDMGVRGTKERCLDHIEAVWTDITPKSVREAIARARENEPATVA